MLFSTQSRTIQDIQDIQSSMTSDNVDDVDFGDASPPEPHLFFSLVFSFFSSLILARTKSNGLRLKKTSPGLQVPEELLGEPSERLSFGW